MAREATITQDQVNAIANALRADSVKPTARAIRDKLGTGSMATVLKYLQVWQSGQIRPADTPVILSSVLQRILVDFVAQEVAAAKAELQTELVAIQQSNEDLITESERQAMLIEKQSETIELFLAEKAELGGRLGQMENDLATARNEAVAERRAAENARTELAKDELRLEAMPRLEADLDKLRIELESERNARVTAEQDAAVLKARLEAETQAAGLRSQIEVMKAASKTKN